MLTWYQKPADSIPLEEATEILQDTQNREHFPKQFQNLLKQVQETVTVLKEKSKELNPLAWFQPSYEQTLKLNVWIYGIDYIVDFDANRVGKTAAGVVNAEMWIIPNEPEWMMFREHTDHLQRTFRTIMRPPISALADIRALLQKNNLKGDPSKSLDDPTNKQIFDLVSANFLNNPDYKPTPNPKKRTMWIGAPDNDYQKEIVMPEFKKWLPPHFIDRFSEYDLEIKLKSPKFQATLIFKSYDSKDTKWSGAAVDGIMLTEGVPVDVFNEVRQRYKYPAFASWDYTPYEARNTATKSALAHKVFTGKEQLPLHPFIFSGFGIESAPTYILPEEKRQDLIKMWQGKPQGEARIKGNFYSSSPTILKNYNETIHELPWTLEDLRKYYKDAPLFLFRGLDPGWGHVTGCSWMALAPDNTRYIYQVYAETQRSIEERCHDIITLSGNERIRHPKSKTMFLEKPSTPKSQIKLTWIDYHTFKTDENTKRPFANNYINAGVIVRPSITFGPKERATMFNDLLTPQTHLCHPLTKKSPGSRLYFLTGGYGVKTAISKITNLFWATFDKGEKRGISKDTPQDYDDDEFDSLCYVALPSLNYASFLVGANSSTIRRKGQDFSSSVERAPQFSNLTIIK